ncbi:MAG: hypothetical protein MZV70_45920 [Desulfobacterales bacterium]|nr:hypothetical protein [Desulfobacterales bacterium]
MDIVIVDEIKPTFVQIGPLCQNSVAPLLPAVSTNGIKGIWSPSIINTSVVGITEYSFTPDAGQCAIPVKMNIEILDKIIPLFAQPGPLCQNSVAPLLPAVSANGIPGTWSPSIITTAIIGTSTYKFTPAAGQCAVPITMNIEISDKIIPLFTQIGPLCQNSVAPVLPLVSTNGINGTWNPSIIDTKVLGIFKFTFNPTATQCEVPVTMEIEITDGIKPLFTQLGPLCQNSVAPLLPSVSTNGITGTWIPLSLLHRWLEQLHINLLLMPGSVLYLQI